MLSFAEAAERLVKDRIAPNMTAEGLRRLARDPHSGWPIAEGDYRVVGKVRLLPYEVLVPYVRERLEKRPGRGPAKQPRKKRTFPPEQQGAPMTTTVDSRIAILSRLHMPPYDDAAGTYSTPMGEAAQLLDAYRAAVLREAAQRLYTALFPTVYDDMGQKAAEGVNRAVSELRRMADEMGAQDG